MNTNLFQRYGSLLLPASCQGGVGLSEVLGLAIVVSKFIIFLSNSGGIFATLTITYTMVKFVFKNIKG